MAKDSRFQYAYRKNASKLHKAVGDILRSDATLSIYPSFQEYPVNKVNTEYHTGSHKFDWVVPKLKMVIECHGKQHYEVIAFDGNVDNAVEAFHDLKTRDETKKRAALAAGWAYVVIPYTYEKKVTAQLIFDRLEEARFELQQYQEEHAEEIRQREDAKEQAKLAKFTEEKRYKKEARKRYLESQAHQRELRMAREFRQKRYRRLKELKDGPRQ